MNSCSYWLRDVIAYGPYAWTVLGNMSERDHEFQLKYSIIEFFLTLLAHLPVRHLILSDISVFIFSDLQIVTF